MSWFDRVKAKLSPKKSNDPAGIVPPMTTPAPSRRWAWRLGGAGVVILLLLGYYLLGAVLLTRIDASPTFRPGRADLPANGSETVAMMSALLNREVNDYGWKPNNPWLYPTALMDNMPNFQLGILASLRAVGLEMRDSVGRLRGSGGTDKDLEAVYSALSYPPDRWIVSTHFPFLGTSSQSFYRDAIKGLRSYNARVGSGQATYERRVDTLQRQLDRLSLSLGSASNDLDKQMQNPGGLFDTAADDVFYRAKGQSYAAYLLLSAMSHDYAQVIQSRAIGNLWVDMMDELKQGIALKPWIVSNGASDSTLVANHLAAQAVHVERARQRLREITAILQQ